MEHQQCIPCVGKGTPTEPWSLAAEGVLPAAGRGVLSLINPTILSQRASFLRLDEEYYAEVAAGRAAASGSTALAALVWGSQLVRFCFVNYKGCAMRTWWRTDFA